MKQVMVFINGKEQAVISMLIKFDWSDGYLPKKTASIEYWKRDESGELVVCNGRAVRVEEELKIEGIIETVDNIKVFLQGECLLRLYKKGLRKPYQRERTAGTFAGELYDKESIIALKMIIPGNCFSKDDNGVECLTVSNEQWPFVYYYHLRKEGIWH